MIDLHLVHVGEDCLPVMFANNLGIVPQLGAVGKVGHQDIERLQIRGFRRYYLKLGFL